MNKLDQTKIPLKCPGCHKPLEPTIQFMHSNRHIKCSCGSEIEVGLSQASALRMAVQKKEKAEQEFEEALTKAISTATQHTKRQ